MNDDELLVSRLRTMAGNVPPVPIDRAEVLRRGRRRRVLRASGTTMGVGVLCAGLYLGAGGAGDAPVTTLAPAASGPSPTAPVSPAGPGTVEAQGAVVDEASGTITLPLDSVLLGRHEHATITSAREVYLASCLTEAGFGDTLELVGPVRVPPGNGNAERYGAWRLETLEQTGYGVQEEVDPNVFRSSGPAEARRAECLGEIRAQGLDWDPSQFEESAPTGWTQYDTTGEGRAVLAEWRQCLTDAGVEPPAEGQGMVPPAAVGASLDEQVRIGRIDVGCKDELDVVQRLADVDAAGQSEYIARAGDQLEQRRSVEQAALAASQAYLTSQGLSMDDPAW
ncbi:hypothetical protein [Oerskovia paurometabola]|uniref:Uncharacterized protein n=1 Tax=Oerskovia paurometabola TaxID=162170 RepID=A0ABW1XAZ4_9CELL|nr:hypothetical protein [Oerskovia paurometabola]MBM7499119.1 hypothetical protein [Oerskovia paurometabola]